MRALDVCAGIGNFTRGLEMAGIETVAFVERDRFCRAELSRTWPTLPIYDDLTTLTKERLDNDGITPIDILTAGLPCQPFSAAGRKGGTQDDRHLWPYCFKIIAAVRPVFVLLENVPNVIQMGWLDGVCYDLEGIGYAQRAFIIPACAVGLPHRRDRVFIVAADTTGLGFQKTGEKQRTTGIGKCVARYHAPDAWTTIEPFISSGDHGYAEWSNHIKAVGNSVVPSIVAALADGLVHMR